MSGNQTPSIHAAEHIGPQQTGDNVEAKRVANYGWSALNNQWQRMPLIQGLIPEAYDYILLGYTGANLTTVTYKTGGPAGNTVATLTLAYSGSTLTSVTRS